MNESIVANSSPRAPMSETRALLRVRPVMQMLLATAAASFEARRFARTVVLEWAAAKWPALLPRTVRDDQDFEHDQPGLEIATINLPDRGLWGFRVEHPDSAVPGRMWEVEVVVAAVSEQSDAIGVRSQCTTDGSGELIPTSPRFVKQWLERLDLIDASRRVSTAATDVDTLQEVAELVELLADQRRTLPIIVVSENAGGDWAIDASALARRTAGLAHVIRLHAPQAPALTERLGKELSVYNGAVRTYLPGFGQPSDAQIHTNVLANRIGTWPAADGQGPGAFVDFLVAQMHRFSVGSQARRDQLPSFVQLRRFKVESERDAQLQRIAALQLALEARPQQDRSGEIEILQAQLTERETEVRLRSLKEEEARGRAADAEALFSLQAVELAAVQEERDALIAVNLNLQAGLSRFKKARGEIERLPTSYDEIASWADEELFSRLILHSRARRSLKSAMFSDVSLVVKSLKLLANEYWVMRTSEPSAHAAAKNAFETRMQELSIDEAPSMSDVTRGRFEEQYTVKYQIRHTATQTLDRHLRGGSNTKDDRYCMRIYFFWDDEQQKVVVGHLPSHLDTLAS